MQKIICKTYTLNNFWNETFEVPFATAVFSLTDFGIYFTAEIFCDTVSKYAEFKLDLEPDYYNFRENSLQIACLQAFEIACPDKLFKKSKLAPMPWFFWTYISKDAHEYLLNNFPNDME